MAGSGGKRRMNCSRTAIGQSGVAGLRLTICRYTQAISGSGSALGSQLSEIGQPRLPRLNVRQQKPNSEIVRGLIHSSRTNNASASSNRSTRHRHNHNPKPLRHRKNGRYGELTITAKFDTTARTRAPEAAVQFSRAAPSLSTFTAAQLTYCGRAF
jgi:hypothetical protein